MTPRKSLCYGFINEIDTMEKAGGVPILAGGVCPVPAGEGDRHRRQVYGVVGRAKNEGQNRIFKTLRGGLFFKYFLSYFLVFSVPLLLTLFMYSSSARIISAQSSSQATSLLGLLLCYLLTKKNSKPLKLIIRSLTTVYDHGRFDPEDDFQFIENAVSALVASNLAYHEKEKDIGSKTDREVLWRLFLGEGIDTAAFQRDLDNSSIRLAGTQFVTGYLHVHGLDNSKQSAFFTKSSLWALLSQLFPEEGKSVHPLVIDKSNLVFLAVFGQEEAASQFCGELSLRLEGLGKQIEKDTGWHLDFFLSEAMRLAENVQVGYQQCKDLALRVVKDSGKFVYTTQDLPAFQQIYRYTMDQELRLAQLLQYGTQEELQAFLDELFEQNLRKLQLSDGMQKLLHGGAEQRLAQPLPLPAGERRHPPRDAELPQELRAYLSQLQEATQRSLGIQAQQAQEEKKQAVLAFIKEHYGDADLMIYPLCEELGCSESSLNRFIHEQLGLSFSDLLEKTRMEAACALLQRDGLTVKAIAEQTGYASDASFRRAFKRVMGVSPSDYLRAHRAEGSPRKTHKKGGPLGPLSCCVHFPIPPLRAIIAGKKQETGWLP